MTPRNDAKPAIPEGKSDKERPRRPDPDPAPDTMEGPGARNAARPEEDPKNKVTRTGER